MIVIMTIVKDATSVTYDRLYLGLYIHDTDLLSLKQSLTFGLYKKLMNRPVDGSTVELTKIVVMSNYFVFSINAL